MNLKVNLYLEASVLEAIARGDKPYIGTFSILPCEEGGRQPEGKWLAGCFELKCPSRDQAVMWAEKQLRSEQAMMNAGYEERIQRLLALTWEAPQ